MRKKRFIGISAILCFVLAIVFFGWSFTDRSKARFFSSALKKCEQRITLKQKNAEAIGEQLLLQQRVRELPPDVTVYSFIHDRLQAWALNDIPAPGELLAAVDTVSRFVQIGYSWYVTKAKLQDSVKIVTVLLIKKGYSYENDFLQSAVNAALFSPDVLGAEPFTGDVQYAVLAEDGTPLFSVVFDDSVIALRHIAYRWLAIGLFIAGLFLWLSAAKKIFLSRSIAIGLLLALRFQLFLHSSFFEPDIPLFSSSLYADSLALPSLGSLLLHALFIFIIAVILFRAYRKNVRNYSRKKMYWLSGSGLVAVGVFICFMHYILRSLIMNSTIPLNLPQLDQLTLYTFVAYGILVLLGAALFILLYIVLSPFAKQYGKLNIRGYSLLFIGGMVLYTLITLKVYGHEKEDLQTKALAGRLALEHDPTAELILNTIEIKIAEDTYLRHQVLHDAHADDIHYYIAQHYLQGYMQHYDLQVTVCPRGTKLRIDAGLEEVDCWTFFEDEIRHYGTRLNDTSSFYYLANNNGRNSYMGRIAYSGAGNETVVFLELDSKLYAGGEGYPKLLLEKDIANKTKIPEGYSYAKYADKRLINSFGDYNYPSTYNRYFPEGDKSVVNNGYVHFMYYPEAHYMIVISRTTHTFWSLIILFSYLFLIFSVGLFLLSVIAGIPFVWRRSNNAFQRKIALLLIASFIISIVFTAIFTISYNIGRYRKTSRLQMEEKMRTVLTRLDTYLNNTLEVNDVDELGADRELYQLSNSMQIDINLYDTNGHLVLTSRPEIFERQLQSTRMNRAAFDRLSSGRIVDYTDKERIGNLAFYSVYATYHNIRGQAVAYVNIPYFSRRMNDIRDASTVVTTIVNMYILALILAILVGGALTGRLLRPLEVVRRHMQRLDVTEKMEYIQYHEKDEIGDLVRAYNQMINALEESTQKLAQSERESAWREMARQIAHEIKNPLTPMRLSIQHLMRLKKENALGWQTRVDELLPALLEQIDTLAKTASEFANFAKASTEKPVAVSLNTLLNELQPLFDTYKNVRFRWNRQVKDAIVSGHPDQLSRVLVNLLTNAVQAVQDKPDGQITVTLAGQALDYFISIEDNGKGVEEELQQNLFTPNFTTKSSGSGLGLAISRNIMEQEGGAITYKRSEMGGACFVIQLPKQKV